MSGPDFWPKSYAKPAEDVGDIPDIDNTVKVGRMNADGTIEFTGTEPAFPTEEERKAKDKKTGHIAESRPRVRIQRVDWGEIWPSIEQRMQDNPNIDAQTLAGHYGVPYLELHIRMQEWKKANVKGADKVIEKKKLTKYTQEERLEMARQIKDKVAMGYTKLGAAKELGIAPGNADRWLKELAKYELEEYDKQANPYTILAPVDEGKRAASSIEYTPERALDEAQKEPIYHLAGPDYVSPSKPYAPEPANTDLTLDDLKAQWCEETLRLMNIPAIERLAIVVQIATIGG